MNKLFWLLFVLEFFYFNLSLNERLYRGLKGREGGGIRGNRNK